MTDTHVGGFDFIPPQPDRSVDAEPGLAWDRTGGPHNGRAYLVYTAEQRNESDNTDIEVRYSDNDGASWSAPMRVNDDATTNSQFLRKISLDPTSGHLAVSWYDARHDLGTPAVPATPTGYRTTTLRSSRRSDRRHRVHAEPSGQRRHVQREGRAERDRLRRLQRPGVLRRAGAPGVGRQLEQRRRQPGRQAAPARRLHRDRPRALTAAAGPEPGPLARASARRVGEPAGQLPHGGS